MNAPTPKILIIDDDPHIVGVLSLALEDAHFQVSAAHSGKEGLHAAYEQHPDLILLDISMPGMDGFEVLDHLRVVTDIPVIMLTAMGQDPNRIRGMDKGAADFITKGTSMEVLVAVIHARLRDTEPRRTHEGIRHFDRHLQVDLQRRRVWVEEEMITLTPLQWRLFQCLIENEGRVATFQKLVNAGWDSPDYGDARSVKVQISLLREKIHDSPRAPHYIHTMREEGYMFEVRSA